MQVFCPFKEPIKVAQCLDSKRLNKQIIENKQILNAINGTGKGWFNHPIVRTYATYRRWLKYYDKCLRMYRLGYKEEAETWNNIANTMTPPFLTEEFCDQHKRRLYTKDKEYYKQFAKYGESEINWYFANGKLLKYKDGKRVE